MAWIYKDGNREVGPIDKAQLQQLIKSGKVKPDTLVRRHDGNQWRPLAQWVQGKAPPPPGSDRRQKPRPSGAQAPPPPPESAPAPRPEDDAPIRTAKTIPFQFNGSGGEYFKIWIVNILLSILTLGIYSAWAKVRRKQYFYGNTSVDGASFQYLADPIKILKGRIIVFSGFALYSAANFFFPPLGAILILVFIPVFPWLLVRSLAFNAGNSAWRNIRFTFHGTYWEAFKIFVLWPLLMPFTLGCIAPYLFYRQKKFVVDRSAYGTSRFDFKATAGDYYRVIFKLLIPFAASVTLVVIAGAFYNWVHALLPVVVAGFYLYGLAYFAVRFSNLLFNSCRVINHGFRATMAIKDFAWIVVTNTLATVVTLGLFHPFAKVRAYRYKISQLALLARGDLNQFVAAEQEQVSALGDEMSDFMDFDFGL